MKKWQIDSKVYNRKSINSGWYANHGPKKASRSFTYSAIAIEILCLLKVRFGLTLRSVQGFVDLLFVLVRNKISIPNYSTPSRRMGKSDLVLNDSLGKNDLR